MLYLYFLNSFVQYAFLINTSTTTILALIENKIFGLYLDFSITTVSIPPKLYISHKDFSSNWKYRRPILLLRLHRDIPEQMAWDKMLSFVGEVRAVEKGSERREAGRNEPPPPRGAPHQWVCSWNDTGAAFFQAPHLPLSSWRKNSWKE